MKLADNNKSEGSTMLTNWFKKVDVHLCPEVKGRIVYQGEPVEGLKILRQLAYNDMDVIKDEVLTDTNGEFYFAEKNIKLAKRKLGFQYQGTKQVIVIVDKDKSYRKKSDDVYYRLWNSVHHGIKNSIAYDEKLNSLDCDLSDNEVYFLFNYREDSPLENKFDSYGTTICRWENDFLIEEEY